MIVLFFSYYNFLDDKPIPTELRKEADELMKQIEYDDDKTIMPYNLIDDEYADNKNLDPKILLTTSRNPSQRLLQFLKVFFIEII